MANQAAGRRTTCSLISRLSGSAVAFAAVGLVATHAEANVFEWTNAVDGSFTVTGNWTKVSGSDASARPGGTVGVFDDAIIDAAGASDYTVALSSTLSEGLESLVLDSPDAIFGIGWSAAGPGTMRQLSVRTLIDFKQGTVRFGRGSGTSNTFIGAAEVRNSALLDLRVENGLPIVFDTTGGFTNLAAGVIQLGVNPGQTSNNSQTLRFTQGITNAGTIVMSTVTPGSGTSNTFLDVSGGNRTLVNTGTIEVLKGAGGVTSFTVNNLGSFYNGATSTGGNDAQWNQRNLMVDLDNQGDLKIDNAVTRETRLGLVGAAANHTNTGTIEIGAGSILRLTDNNTLENKAAGTIAGSGKLEVILSGSSFTNNTNDGAFAPGVNGAGKLSVLIQNAGTLSNSDTASLEIELGGTDAGVSYDQLAVLGATIDAWTGWSIAQNNATFNLDGDLDVSFIDGFLSSISGTDSFTILTASAVTGFFDNATPVSGNVGSLSLAEGTFDVTYNTDSVVLSNFQAVPEPASLALLALGSVLIATRRR